MPNQDRTKIVLITGANSGIGNATAQQLVRAGYITYGGVRRQEAFAAVQAVGAIPLLVDVTDDSSMKTAVHQVEERHTAIDVLINNAGYGQMGPIEEIAIHQWHQQFQTNVFGLVRMTQLVLPAMRRQHRGQVINLGSAGGEFTFPLAGAYHATKYAVESISDALRFEVKPFGINVTVIQPGPVSTPLASATAESIRIATESPYQAMVNAFRRVSEQPTGYITADVVARTILRVVKSQHPHARYKVGMIAHLMTSMHRLLPARLWDRVIAQFYA